MKRMLYCTCVGLVLSSSALLVVAQQPPQNTEDKVPSAPSQLLISSANAGGNLAKNEGVSSSSLAQLAPVSPKTSFVLAQAPSKKIVDKKFLLFNGLAFGMAIFDVEMTQRCIANQHCQEKNPLMPSSHAGQLGLNLALISGTTWVSYKQKEHNSKTWWLPPLMGTVVHSIGVATGFQHR